MLLAVDTSSLRVSLALFAHGEIVEALGAAANSHDEELAGLFQQTLSRSKAQACDIRGLIIGAGPGSFTGLRIGFAFMKGLAVSLGVPLATLSTFKAAAQAAGTTRLCSVSSDARREELFFAIYERTPGGIVERRAPCIVPTKRASELLDEAAQQAGISSAETQSISLDDPNCVVSLARGLIEATRAEKLDRKAPQSAAQLALIEPLYVRAVAAKSIREREAERAGK